MSRPSALPRTPPGGGLYPRLENLLEEGDDEEEYHPRLEGADDDDDEDDEDIEEVTTTLPTTTISGETLTTSKLSTSKPSTGMAYTGKPSTSSKPSTGAAPASLDDIKRLMRDMEERQDKFLDKALDELQGTVADTFSKLHERLSSLEEYAKTQQTGPLRDRPPLTRPRLHTQNLPTTQSLPSYFPAPPPVQLPTSQRDRYLGSALAAHADARNPRPGGTPSLYSAPPSTLRTSTAPLSSTTTTAHLRGGASGGFGAASGDDHGDGVVEPAGYREAALKVEDIGAFEGKDVEHYIRTLEVISDIYGERRLLLILPRCMKGVAKEWFISIPVDNRHFTRSLDGWAFLLRDGFGEDLRRSKERAESRIYRPWKESVEEYFYDKAAMHKRAEPNITEIELMREIWKGLSPHAVELMVVSWKQYNQKEFRDELIQRQDMVDKSKRKSRFGRGDRDTDGGRDFRPRDRGTGSRWRSRDNAPTDGNDAGYRGFSNDRLRGPDDDCRRGPPDDHQHRRPDTERYRGRNDDEKLRGRDDKNPRSKNGAYHTTAHDSTDPLAPEGATDTPVGTGEESDTPYVSDSYSRSATYRIEVLGTYSSFLRSRTVPAAHELPIVDLPIPPSIGCGLSYLNGHPLPIEVWLCAPTSSTPTVMGCGDTGGQCLIRRDTLLSHVPDVEIVDNPTTGGPRFGGIGGGTLQPRGFALIPVYIPNKEALLGDVQRGKVIRAMIEF